MKPGPIIRVLMVRKYLRKQEIFILYQMTTSGGPQCGEGTYAAGCDEKAIDRPYARQLAG